MLLQLVHLKGLRVLRFTAVYHVSLAQQVPFIRVYQKQLVRGLLSNCVRFNRLPIGTRFHLLAVQNHPTDAFTIYIIFTQG